MHRTEPFDPRRALARSTAPALPADDDVLVLFRTWTPDPGERTAALAALSPDERERHDRFRTPQDADTFLLARAVLRVLLCHRLGIPAERVPLATDAHGRPRLDGAASADFNVAHAGGCVALALSTARVGVDVEDTQRTRVAVDAGIAQFAPDERATLAALPAHERRDAFLRAWTLKEAWGKALGSGLAVGLHAAAFVDAASPRPRLADAAADREWTFDAGRVHSRWTWALARQRTARTLHVLAD